ncbi:MAG: leucine-rich repeat domain-containing protein [Clostridiales bacterium]|nr:leucine-rich repeat domain-containing protein [Clostridiales bacterium]
MKIKHTKKITAIFAAIIFVFLALICLTASGCSYTIDYDYIQYDGEEGYYVVKAGGYVSSLTGTLEIPATYGEGDKEAPVKEIAQEGFRGCAITRLIIPASITKIGIAAFANCAQLEEVEFKEGSTLKEIPQGIFGYDSSLTKVNLPYTVETIGYYAFLECKTLETVNLPQNLKIIRARAFEDCYALSKITFPEGLESIGHLAFYNSALTEVIIPDSVHDTQISVTDEQGEPQTETLLGLGYGAFHTCRSLKKVVVGSGITVLKSGVFGYCDNLEEVYIPSSVTKIEEAYFSGGSILYGHAFHNCTSLKIINYAGTEEEWAQIQIENPSYSYSGSTFNNDALFEDKNDKLTITYNTGYTA